MCVTGTEYLREQGGSLDSSDKVIVTRKMQMLL